MFNKLFNQTKKEIAKSAVLTSPIVKISEFEKLLDVIDLYIMEKTSLIKSNTADEAFLNIIRFETYAIVEQYKKYIDAEYQIKEISEYYDFQSAEKKIEKKDFIEKLVNTMKEALYKAIANYDNAISKGIDDDKSSI